jgi:hypothetical protein
LIVQRSAVKLARKTSPARTSIDEPFDIETDIQEIGCEMVGWVSEFQDSDQRMGFCDKGN